MIKVDIVNEVPEPAQVTKGESRAGCRRGVRCHAALHAARAKRIELRGFGVFQVKPRKRGIGRNPRTGKEVRIPPGRTIRFKPGKRTPEYRRMNRTSACSHHGGHDHRGRAVQYSNSSTPSGGLVALSVVAAGRGRPVFSVPFLGFLTAHEFGHYGAARWHGLRPSLPYYIPAPLR
jgi:DNA-binding protein HU-beta